MKTVDGKLRVDLNKLREIDPDVKGLPKEVVKIIDEELSILDGFITTLHPWLGYQQIKKT